MPPTIPLEPYLDCHSLSQETTNVLHHQSVGAYFPSSAFEQRCISTSGGDRRARRVSVTSMLSIMVYMTVVGELPDTSKPASILIYILAISLLQSTVICLQTILGLNIFYRSDSVKVSSSWIKFLHMFACCKCRRSQNIVSDFTDDQTHRGEKRKTMCSFEGKYTWMAVDKSLDALFFVQLSFSAV